MYPSHERFGRAGNSGGANPEVLDRDGKTALEHAETDAMKALLKEAIEKRSVRT